MYEVSARRETEINIAYGKEEKMEVKSRPPVCEMHSRAMKQRILATEGDTIPYLKQRVCLCVCERVKV